MACLNGRGLSCASASSLPRWNSIIYTNKKVSYCKPRALVHDDCGVVVLIARNVCSEMSTTEPSATVAEFTRRNCSLYSSYYKAQSQRNRNSLSPLLPLGSTRLYVTSAWYSSLVWTVLPFQCH